MAVTITAAYTPTKHGTVDAWTVNGRLLYVSTSFSVARRLLADGYAPDDLLQTTDRHGRPKTHPRPLSVLAARTLRDDPERGMVWGWYDPKKIDAMKARLAAKATEKVSSGHRGGSQETPIDGQDVSTTPTASSAEIEGLPSREEALV
ncbi:MAG TPA: hypothetical protein VHL31_04670 [Geminicoccus sp.]|uniref:hypothetical protein n=1 Tax=Geminicoccus sp. TaxID=2024832 RepID=UPI002E36DB5B|nr:hypothetical protein [Geminicoccus sp.]HEX2525581.1 hypothetical protein [Geminicoccus sp.]